MLTKAWPHSKSHVCAVDELSSSTEVLTSKATTAAAADAEAVPPKRRGVLRKAGRASANRRTKRSTFSSGTDKVV
ncbi:unnamed protein product [Mesocestoides corti]|uniref:Secreted protein n=1 Tax=Mesocestoides corti TaxID=53468 RepID=A0A0R3UBW5_MESCO|nr:unnamed protein product [Mesocestoides corti]